MAQRGSSVITKGNQAAYTQHRTTSQGTVASIQGADGGRAVGANTVYGKRVVKLGAQPIFGTEDNITSVSLVDKRAAHDWQNCSHIVAVNAFTSAAAVVLVSFSAASSSAAAPSTALETGEQFGAACSRTKCPKDSLNYRKMRPRD
jgi:hypothetical protein